MGYNLHRFIAEALGPEITAGQRLVALQIALDAVDPGQEKDDDTRKARESRISLERLARLTGIGGKDPEKTVRTLLSQLKCAGWEFRVPLGGVGRDGRKLYGVEGKALNFRVPTQQGQLTPTKPRSRANKATSVASDPGLDETEAEATSVAPQVTSVVSEVTSVTSQTTLVGPYVLDSASAKHPSNFDASRSDAAATPLVAEGVGRDGSATEDQNHAASAMDVLSHIDFGRNTQRHESRSLVDLVQAKLADGWAPKQLHKAVDGNWQGVRDRVAIVISRLRDLPDKPPRPHTAPSTVPLPPPVAPPDYEHAADPQAVNGHARDARAAMKANGKGAATGSTSPPEPPSLPRFDHEADQRRKDAEKQRKADERAKAEQAMRELRQHRQQVGLDNPEPFDMFPKSAATITDAEQES